MPVKKEPGSVSAFERKRLDNIASNLSLLTEAAEVAKKVIVEKPATRPAPSKRSSRPRPVKKKAPRPVRQSSRLAGLEADNETLKRKLEVEAENQAEEARTRKLRVSDDLKLGDIAVAGKKWAAGLNSLQGLVRGAQPGVRTFTEDDIKETTDKSLKELRERMGGLKLYEHWAPNGTLHPLSLSEIRGASVLIWTCQRYQNHSTENILARSASERGQSRHFRW